MIVVIVIASQLFPEWSLPPPFFQIHPYYIPLRRDTFLIDLNIGQDNLIKINLKRSIKGQEISFKTRLEKITSYTDALILQGNPKLNLYFRELFLKTELNYFLSNKDYKSFKEIKFVVAKIKPDYIVSILSKLSRSNNAVHDKNLYMIYFEKKYHNKILFLLPFYRNQPSFETGYIIYTKKNRFFIGGGIIEYTPELWGTWDKIYKNFYITLNGGIKRYHYNLDSLLQELLVYKMDEEMNEFSTERFLEISIKHSLFTVKCCYKNVHSIFIHHGDIPMVSSDSISLLTTQWTLRMEGEESANYLNLSLNKKFKNSTIWYPLWELTDTIITRTKKMGFALWIEVYGKRWEKESYSITGGAVISYYFNDKFLLRTGIVNLFDEIFECYPGLPLKGRIIFAGIRLKFF